MTNMAAVLAAVVHQYELKPDSVKEPRSKERGIVKLQIPQISLVSQFCGFACSLN
jgi:hypothetical protein